MFLDSRSFFREVTVTSSYITHVTHKFMKSRPIREYESTDNEESGKGKRQVKCLSAHLPHMGKNRCWHSGSPGQTKLRGKQKSAAFKPVLTPISKNDTNPQPSCQINKIGFSFFFFLAFLFFKPSEIFNTVLVAPYGFPKYPSSAL